MRRVPQRPSRRRASPRIEPGDRAPVCGAAPRRRCPGRPAPAVSRFVAAVRRAVAAVLPEPARPPRGRVPPARTPIDRPGDALPADPAQAPRAAGATVGARSGASRRTSRSGRRPRLGRVDARCRPARPPVRRRLCRGQRSTGRGRRTGLDAAVRCTGAAQPLPSRTERTRCGRCRVDCRAPADTAADAATAPSSPTPLRRALDPAATATTTGPVVGARALPRQHHVGVRTRDACPAAAHDRIGASAASGRPADRSGDASDAGHRRARPSDRCAAPSRAPQHRRSAAAPPPRAASPRRRGTPPAPAARGRTERCDDRFAPPQLRHSCRPPLLPATALDAGDWPSAAMPPADSPPARLPGATPPRGHVAGAEPSPGGDRAARGTGGARRRQLGARRLRRRCARLRLRSRIGDTRRRLPTPASGRHCTCRPVA